MSQDIHLHFQLISRRIQEWQREQERRRQLRELKKVHRVGIWHRILGHLNKLFMTPGTSKQQYNTSFPLEGAVSEEERLVRDGFTNREIAALYRLRQWHQENVREHSFTIMMRHWEFLKLLVNSGRLEV